MWFRRRSGLARGMLVGDVTHVVLDAREPPQFLGSLDNGPEARKVGHVITPYASSFGA